MRFTRHQLFALILGAGMATILPAQTRKADARNGRPGGDSARIAMRQGRMDSARVALRGDTTRTRELRERFAVGASPAAMILGMRERLGLTDDQVNRLESLKSSFVEPGQGDITSLREELAAASKGEANIQAARAALEKINAQQTNALLARLEARNKARAVLNTDQQVQFDALEARRPMPGMMGPGGAAGGRGQGMPPAGAGRGGGRARGGPPGTPPPAQ